NRAAAFGAKIHTYTRVLDIERRSDGTFNVTTSKGKVRAMRIVNAAGAWSPEIARFLGVTLPNHPHRHEIMSSEPLKPFLGPLVSLLSSGLYFSQSMRGEIVAGITTPETKHGEGAAAINMQSRLLFLELIAAELVSLVPLFAQLKVVRQWAGPY